MKWSICIVTVPQRKVEFNRIKGMLEYQIGDRDVEIIVDDSDEKLGQKRQNCIDRAHGDYVNFVDDDDLVAHDYVKTIYPLLDGVDYVGFQVQLYESGKKMKPTYHSLKYKQWGEDSYGWYRNVSHLNPIKKEIALASRFSGGIGEDFRWAQGLEPKTEHYIDRPMYFYFHSLDHSLAVEA